METNAYEGSCMLYPKEPLEGIEWEVDAVIAVETTLAFRYGNFQQFIALLMRQCLEAAEPVSTYPTTSGR